MTTKKSLEEALAPRIKRIRELVAELGEDILFSGMGDCGCMGPRGDDPLCGCAMDLEARKFVAREMLKNDP